MERLKKNVFMFTLFICFSLLHQHLFHCLPSRWKIFYHTHSLVLLFIFRGLREILNCLHSHCSTLLKLIKLKKNWNTQNVFLQVTLADIPNSMIFRSWSTLIILCSVNPMMLIFYLPSSRGWRIDRSLSKSNSFPQ